MRTFAPKRFFLLAIALAGITTPTLATEWAFCGPGSSAAEIGLLMGSPDIGALSGVTLSAAREEWTTNPAFGTGAPITVGQVFEDETSFRLDLMDSDYVLLAQLRLFKAAESDGTAAAGTLRIIGKGAWPVTCDEF